MGYYIKKTGSGKSLLDRWSSWSEIKKTYVKSQHNKIVNTDGKNGGWTGATVVSE